MSVKGKALLLRENSEAACFLEIRMSTAPTSLQVHIHLSRLRHNWELLCRAGAYAVHDDGWPCVLPVVKADAYGHGMARVARVLLRDGAGGFALGSVGEAVFLRKHMPKSVAPPVKLLALRGARDAAEAAAAVEYGIVPLVCTAEQAGLLASAAGRRAALHIAVKIDTGMSRQGFRHDELAACIQTLRRYPRLRPALAVSHAASADVPDKWEEVRVQAERFLSALRQLREVWPDIRPSLSNSAGILAPEMFPAALAGQVSRPGFSLYGGNPFAGTVLSARGEGFLPVMEAAAPVLELRVVRQGEAISYGGAFVAPEDMRVAVIGAGYADGVSRGLSGNFSLSIRGVAAPVLGRVCMQMMMADVGNIPDVRVGDAAYLLGGDPPYAVTPELLAAAWGTIPYEAFCILGKNPRVYYSNSKSNLSSF